jgi:hypothetical protein
MPDRKRSIEVDFLVDDSDKRKLKGIGDEAHGVTGRFDGLKGAVGGFLTIAAAQQLGQFVTEVASMGAAAQTAADSATKVLGPALEDLHGNLEEVRLAMGYNVGELDTLIAQLGLLTDSMFTTDEAQAEFIEWLITTGGELAAFKGDLGLSDEAVAALGATLRGEYDSLEQFGVKVSDAAIEEEKLRLQADPANASLSDQQLELLALRNIITEKANPAIGSLAEAQEGLAGKTNEATTRIDDLKIKLGQQFAPVLEDVLENVTNLMTELSGGEGDLEEFGYGIDSLQDDFEDWKTAIEGVVGWLGQLWDGLNRSWDGFTEQLNDLGNALANTSRARSQAMGGGGGGGATGRGGGRQHGGPVHAGMAYRVGEQGPETFVPGRNGRIMPAGAGGVYNITINAGLGSDPNAISKAVVQALQRYERANGIVPIRTMK